MGTVPKCSMGNYSAKDGDQLRVLFVSSALPPFAESQTIRSVYLIERLFQLGFKLILVSPYITSSGVDKTLLELLPSHCQVVRTPPPSYDRTIATLSRLPGGNSLVWLYSNLAYRLAVPDVRWGWDDMAFRVCQNLITAQRPDVIVSASGSFTAHVAARRLAQRHNIPWVADLGDPWSLLGRKLSIDWLRDIRNRSVELATIPFASGSTFTTKETIHAYRDWLGSKMPRAVHIPYGYRAADFSASKQNFVTGKEERPLRLSYIGAAYRSDRNLIPTIRAMYSLQKQNGLKHGCTLNIVGQYSAFFRREASRLSLANVKFCGRVSYRQSIDWMLKSDVLLILGNKGALQIPGKVYSCLASGRPILYIYQRPPEADPTYRLLRAFPGVLSSENSKDAIRVRLKELDAKFHDVSTVSFQRRDQDSLKQYEASAIGDRLASFLRQVVTTGEK